MELLAAFEPAALAANKTPSGQPAAEMKPRAVIAFTSCCDQIKRAVDFLSRQADLMEAAPDSSLEMAATDIESQFKAISSTVGFCVDVVRELADLNFGVAGSWLDVVAAMLDMLQHWCLEGGPLNDDWERDLCSAKGLKVLLGLSENDARLGQFVWPLLIASPSLRVKLYDQADVVIPAALLALKQSWEASSFFDSWGNFTEIPLILVELLEEMTQSPDIGGPILSFEAQSIFADFGQADQHLPTVLGCLRMAKTHVKKCTLPANAEDLDKASLFAERLLFVLLKMVESVQWTMDPGMKEEVLNEAASMLDTLPTFEALSKLRKVTRNGSHFGKGRADGLAAF